MAQKKTKPKSKPKPRSKVVKIRPIKKENRISNEEALFRDKMELHFGITNVDYLSSLFRAVQKFTGSVSELNRVHGFQILDVVSFRNNEGEIEDGS